MAISFHSQVSKFNLKKKKKIIDWILLVAYLERFEVNEISYVFCDDEFLLKLNNDFLHHNYYTDIVTFDYSASRKIEAEIYISIERVKENSKLLNTYFEEELGRVMIHGLLHCMGYSDKSKWSQNRMRKRENECLKLFSQIK